MQRVLYAGPSRTVLRNVRITVGGRGGCRNCYHVIRCSSEELGIRSSAARYAVTNLTMPAMSPTMTEGGIAQWKKQEGEIFSAGDVLLEIVRRGSQTIHRNDTQTFSLGNRQGDYRR